MLSLPVITAFSTIPSPLIATLSASDLTFEVLLPFSAIYSQALADDVKSTLFIVPYALVFTKGA